MNQWERWDEDWECRDEWGFQKCRWEVGLRDPHQEDEALWLNFAHYDSVLLTMMGDSSFFFSAVDRPPDLLQPDLRSSRSFQILCSLELQIISDRPLFFGAPDCFPSSSVFLQSYSCRQKSSLKDSVLLFRTRVYKTWDLCGIILPSQQVGIDSLTLKF